MRVLPAFVSQVLLRYGTCYVMSPTSLRDLLRDEAHFATDLFRDVPASHGYCYVMNRTSLRMKIVDE